ncbi:glycosyltransferase family 4 protein [Thermogutta sp.]|uniref:glycosyltransferase family 4 protein n=1 Tax=Thermogutta sp. TaxID=1962930 RepID=UPI003C7A0AE3
MIAARLVCVTRRFWPLVGGAERFMGEFAVEAQRQGRSTTLLTARWEPSWPSSLTYREVPVIRLPQFRARFVGTLVYMAALRRWLRRHQSTYDLVFVSLLKHDAVAAHWAVKGRRPLVLIAEGSGSTGDCAWQEQAVLGMWIRRICYRADAVIAPSREIQEELLQAGYPPQKIHYLPHGVKIPPERTPERRYQARQSLAALHPRFHLQPDEKLAVFVGRLHLGKGLRELVEAWKLVVQRCPNLRLWLVGEGPMETELLRQIEAAKLHSRVVLTGSFDDVGEILQAADLFVFPSHREGMSLALLEAMAAGLPIVATDIPGNRALVQNDESALLVPVDSPKELAGAVARLAENRELAERLAQRARFVAVMHFSLEETVRRHLELFDQIYTQFMKNVQIG